MNFYDIGFLKTQAGLTDYLWYIFIFGSLILLIVVFSLYLKHRIKTKYRDLSLIFSCFSSFLLGYSTQIIRLISRVILNPPRWSVLLNNLPII